MSNVDDTPSKVDKNTGSGASFSENVGCACCQFENIVLVDLSLQN
jgi:hypothetical protein